MFLTLKGEARTGVLSGCFESLAALFKSKLFCPFVWVTGYNSPGASCCEDGALSRRQEGECLQSWESRHRSRRFSVENCDSGNSKHPASHLDSHHQPETELLECIFLVWIFFAVNVCHFFHSTVAISLLVLRTHKGWLMEAQAHSRLFSFHLDTLSAKMGANIMGPRALESSNSTFQ